jgi:hypothetical protein
VPPAPPPPPPSFCGVSPTAPFAAIVPVPETLPARTSTMPPPAPPLDSTPDELLREPAPPPPPITSRLLATGTAAPPKPPRARFEMYVLPPTPPAPAFAPPPPPEFWSFSAGSPSVPPPPALPGAPRAALPLDRPSTPGVDERERGLVQHVVRRAGDALALRAVIRARRVVAVVGVAAAALSVSARPAPPRKPAPDTSIVWPASVSVPAMSIASTPPTLPSHASALSPAPSVALEYCGTRITW